jgi:glutamate-1-semialdehyde 2,1-aminomutase
VTADLACYGKIIGGGLPVGAFGGRAAIMCELAPEGPCYQAGTLSGNPLATAAGIAVLEAVAAPGLYDRLEAGGAALEAAFTEAQVPVVINRVGSMLTPFFADAPVTDYASATASDTGRYGAFARELLARGVYPPPSQFEAWFVSASHSDADFARTATALAEANQASVA